MIDMSQTVLDGPAFANHRAHMLRCYRSVVPEFVSLRIGDTAWSRSRAGLARTSALGQPTAKQRGGGRVASWRRGRTFAAVPKRQDRARLTELHSSRC
jgi:hypothetical protein